MERAPSQTCCNCGRRHRPWLLELALSQLAPFTVAPSSPASDDEWRCARCRPRRDDGHRRVCRAVRDRYGVSQRYWSHVVGVDVRTIVRWESGAPEPSGSALELLTCLDQAAALNPKVVGLIRSQVRRNVSHAQLVAELLVRAAGGVVKRRRRPQPPPPDGLVSVTIRLTPGERARLGYEAFRRGSTVSEWVRGSLFHGNDQGDSIPEQLLNKRVDPSIELRL